jgi:ankyrin repeat protein
MDRQPQGLSWEFCGFTTGNSGTVQSGGATALHFAAEHGHQVVLRLLLKDGVIKDAVMAAGFLKRSKPWNVFTSQILGLYNGIPW